MVLSRCRLMNVFQAGTIASSSDGTDFSCQCIKLAGIELMYMIRKGQMVLKGCEGMSYANQFYALAGKMRLV